MYIRINVTDVELNNTSDIQLNSTSDIQFNNTRSWIKEWLDVNNWTTALILCSWLIPLVSFCVCFICALPFIRHMCLSLAASKGYLKIYKVLTYGVREKNPILRPGVLSIYKGPELINKDGLTLLHAAAFKGQLNIVDFIMVNTELILPLSNDGETPLHLAATNGHIDICRILKNVEKAESPDYYGFTPLDIAHHNKHFEVCQLLSEDTCTKRLLPWHKYVEKELSLPVQKRLQILLNLINLTEDIGSCHGLFTRKKGTKGIVTKFVAINPLEKGLECFNASLKKWEDLRGKIVIGDTTIEVNNFEYDIENQSVAMYRNDHLTSEAMIKTAFSYAKSFLKKNEPSNTYFEDNLNILIIRFRR